MKRGILVATLMVTAAGVASANLLTTTAPQGVGSPLPQARLAQAQPATEAPRLVTKTVAEKTTAAPASTAPTSAPSATKGTPAATLQKASVEPRQAPVPFQMKSRPPVNLPPVADKATDAKATDKPGESKPGEPKPGEPSSELSAGETAAARAAIEADGYKGVKVLRKGANGVWHASALRGKTTVMLTVDASGSVSAD